MSNKAPRPQFAPSDYPAVGSAPCTAPAPEPQFRDRIIESLSSQTRAQGRLEDAITLLRAKLHGSGKCGPEDSQCEPLPEITVSYLSTRAHENAERAHALADELYELVNSL